MSREQYLCIKAIHNEVDGLIRDGWKVKTKTHDPNFGLMYYLIHDFRGSMLVQSNSNLTCMSIYKNGVLKKCQNYGV